MTQLHQTTIFDAIAAKRAGQDAMEACEAANWDWTEWMRGEVRIWLREHPTVCADDIRLICERSGRWPKKDNRAFGALLRSLVAAGEIEAALWENSGTVTSHGRPIRIFRRRAGHDIPSPSLGEG